MGSEMCIRDRGDGKTIAFQDAIGVTMGAVRDLANDVDEIKRRVA